MKYAIVSSILRSWYRAEKFERSLIRTTLNCFEDLSDWTTETSEKTQFLHFAWLHMIPTTKLS